MKQAIHQDMKSKMKNQRWKWQTQNKKAYGCIYRISVNVIQ